MAFIVVVSSPINTNENIDLYLAITTVVHELLSLGKSRFAAIRTLRRRRSPRMIGQ